ncbi:MAG: response regulator [Deltaproteobacteria bacterium]|jgi:signal transduction histidine kinase/FixJ family two-component response regulator|nr:response regulator [Deltaproteobacteria bacterium]
MNEKLLLVDDEEGIRKVLGISLSDSGYTVFTAQSGEEALDIFRRENPAIVLTDIKMPGMDGIKLLRALKQENPDTEVIMITGHGDMDLAIKSLKYQAIDFVTKPINEDVLEIALNRAHEKIRMRQQLREYTENLESLVREKSAKLIEIERQVAVGQAVEGLSAAMRDMAVDLEGGLTYFNEMPCFVSIHSPELKVIAVNPLYRDRLGDKVGHDSWEVYEGKTGTKANCPAAETYNSGIGVRARATVKTASGDKAPVMVNTAPIRNQNGDVELVVEISADLAEVKRLQEELDRSQQRYQQLFDEVPCYISVQDRQFRLTAANRRFKEDFDTEYGAFCYELYKHRNEPCPNCPVMKTFEDGQSHQTEMVVTSKAGERYNVLIWTAPLRNSAGEVTHVMEMSTNITQIRQLQDNLSSLGLKISSISHGIKGLLTGLDGGMYLVESGFNKDKPERVQKGWEDIKTIVGRIRKLVHNILFFAKERELKPTRIAGLNFAEDVAATVETRLKASGINFVRDFDDSVGMLHIDAGVLRLALINILENALDACLEDQTQNKHKIGFRVGQDAGQVIFEISDNGIGMDQETCEKLFTLFFSTKGNKGTGLGLFIAAKIVDQHGGKISVESKRGRGSTFKVSIPNIEPESAKTKENIE